MDEIVKDFLIESNENLDRLDQELVKLESEPSSGEAGKGFAVVANEVKELAKATEDISRKITPSKPTPRAP